MKKKLWIAVAALVLISLIVVKLAGNKRKIEEKKAVSVDASIEVPVNITAAKLEKIQGNLVKTGTLIPFSEANITASASGNLQSVTFDLGSNVQNGQVIAQTDNTLLNLKLEAALLQQQKLQRDYNRYSKLLAGEATTETNLQDIKYNLDNATNQIGQIKKQIADNLIKAPISGQVTEKKVEAGEFVNPGTVLGKVVNVSKLKVDVQVSENDAYTITLGQKVTITTDLYADKTFDGKVIFVSQQGDAAHNYQVQIELPNSSSHPLKAGTFVYADFIHQGAGQVLQIPRSALVESMKNPYVYVVQNGKATVRKLTIGKDLGANIEVIAGLKNGEQVIVNGQINLAEGTPVRIVK